MLDWEDEGRGMEAAVPVPPGDALQVLSPAPRGAEQVKGAQSARVSHPEQYSSTASSGTTAGPAGMG